MNSTVSPYHLIAAADFLLANFLTKSAWATLASVAPERPEGGAFSRTELEEAAAFLVRAGWGYGH